MLHTATVTVNLTSQFVTGNFQCYLRVYISCGVGQNSFIKMECLIGIQFKDFVLVAADMTTAQSIMVMKSGMKLFT